MKTLNKILLTLASILALMSCEKDGDKIYLQSLGSDELIATTDNVVLSIETSQKVVLSFAWKGQDVHINDTTVGTAAKAKNYMEISLSEDFSGPIYKNETTSNSIAYKGGELNSIVNGLGAKVGEVNNVFFRLGSATGENIPYAYSNVVKVDVTPYVLDMRIGKIIQSSSTNTDLTDTGYFLYSQEDNGIYSGFMFTGWEWYNYFLKEADETMWGTDDNVGEFHITSDAEENKINMWFPGNKGCFYVNVNTVNKTWDALYISSLNVNGLTDSPIELTLDNDNKLWIANFEASEAGEKTITITGSGQQYNVETGTSSSIETNVNFATDENNNLVLAENAGNISVTIPQAGECTIKLDLSVPTNRTVTIESGSSDIPEPESYPETIDMQRWDGTSMVSMITLQRTDSENGIYEGTYDGPYQKNEYYGFEFIVDGTWYRADASDNTKLAISNNALSKFYFDKADDNVTSINVKITVDLKELSWSYVINSQETGTVEEPKAQITMSHWFGEEEGNKTICTLYETEENIYVGEYEGANLKFKFVEGENWYGAQDGDNPDKLSTSGSDTWFWKLTGNDWPENVHVKITVDLNSKTWDYEDITE